MYRSFLRNLLVTSAVAAIVVALSADANATWWKSHGSSGGSSGYYSHGSWGSSGGSSGWYSYGSYGSYGSSGGSSGGLFHRKHVYYGSWGSSGGSSGYSSYGSSGSSGGTYYRVVPSVPAMPAQPETPATPDTPPAEGIEGKATSTGDAVLRVTVADDAQIFVNGRPTTSTGAERQYISRRLRYGQQYSYEVRAIAMRDGREVEETKQVQLRAGETENIAFTLSDTEAAETSLTLRVPEDAKVTLGGNETAATGAVRTFKTTALGDGQAWSDYRVAVSVERDGKMQTQEKVITLRSGEDRLVTFDFETERVADTR